MSQNYCNKNEFCRGLLDKEEIKLLKDTIEYDRAGLEAACAPRDDGKLTDFTIGC